MIITIKFNFLTKRTGSHTFTNTGTPQIFTLDGHVYMRNLFLPIKIIKEFG